jgi:uncharacterized phiE125 gp8 family phage protein
MSMSDRGRLVQLEPPSVEPVSLEQARAHLKLDATGSPATHPDDALVTALIKAARRRVENETGLALIRQKWRLTLEQFPIDVRGRQRMELPLMPTREVSAIRYVDADGETQQWGAESPNESWRLIAGGLHRGGLVVPFYGVVWPTTRAQPDAVEIEFYAGFGADADDVPAELKHALLLDLGHLYENREASVLGAASAPLPLGWEALVWPWRRPVVG